LSLSWLEGGGEQVAHRARAATEERLQRRVDRGEVTSPGGAVRAEQHLRHVRPVENLRSGWDLHVGFGLTNPAMFTAMYGDPRPGAASPAAARALAMLRERMRSLALAGRLRVDERRAADMVRAAACGVVFILLETPEADRDRGLSEATRKSVIAAIITDAPKRERLGVAPAATTLRALLPTVEGLTQGERNLLAEWLDRLVRPA